MPQSIIVSNDYKVDNNRDKALSMIKALYHKYIAIGSEFEINVSYRIRNKMKDTIPVLETLQNTQLLRIFDPSMQAMMDLMNDSFLRFKKTPVCHNIYPYYMYMFTYIQYINKIKQIRIYIGIHKH